MSTMRPEFVKFIPQALVPGVLYISEQYRTASHLCACGCGEKVVTPLSPADWQLTNLNGRVSLSPSIGNWKYTCRSHYWIRRNEIVRSNTMSAALIARIEERDLLDKARHVEQRNQAKLSLTKPHPPQSIPSDSKPPSFWARLCAAILHFLR